MASFLLQTGSIAGPSWKSWLQLQQVEEETGLSISACQFASLDRSL